MTMITREQYLKANKQRRLTLLKKYNITEEEILNKVVNRKYKLIKIYPGSGTLNSILESTEPLSTLYPDNYELYNETKKTVHHIYLIDISASMNIGDKYNSICNNIVGEMDACLDNKEVNNTFTLWEFGTDIICSYTQKDKGTYSKRSSLQNRTNLNGCIIDAINTITVNNNDYYLFKILTDGEDNVTKYTASEVSKKIKNLPSNFTVTFVGTERDVKYCKEVYGLDESNTLIYNNTGEGLKKALETYTVNTRSYSKNVEAGKDVTKSFFDKQYV